MVKSLLEYSNDQLKCNKTLFECIELVQLFPSSPKYQLMLLKLNSQSYHIDILS